MTFPKKGHIPLKGDQKIRDNTLILKKNHLSPEPLSQFKLNLMKTSLRKGKYYFFISREKDNRVSKRTLIGVFLNISIALRKCI